MSKNEMVKKDQMLESFKALEELENRRYIYQQAIKKAKEKIKAAMYSEKYEIPPEPKPLEEDKQTLLGQIGFFLFYGIVGAVITFILLIILWLINALVIEIPMSTTILVALFVIVTTGVALFFEISDKRVRNAKQKEYQEAYDSWLEEANEVLKQNRQISLATKRRFDCVRKELDPDIEVWHETIDKLSQCMDKLYLSEAIPKKYQNAVAMHFFVTYLENGRCDTLKECMNKYDEDVQYYKLKGEIVQVYERICTMEGRLTSEMRSLKSSFESDMRGLSLLIERTSNQIERLNYNQKTLDLLNRWNLLK